MRDGLKASVCFKRSTCQMVKMVKVYVNPSPYGFSTSELRQVCWSEKVSRVLTILFILHTTISLTFFVNNWEQHHEYLWGEFVRKCASLSPYDSLHLAPLYDIILSPSLWVWPFRTAINDFCQQMSLSDSNQFVWSILKPYRIVDFGLLMGFVDSNKNRITPATFFKQVFKQFETQY